MARIEHRRYVKYGEAVDSLGDDELLREAILHDGLECFCDIPTVAPRDILFPPSFISGESDNECDRDPDELALVTTHARLSATAGRICAALGSVRIQRVRFKDFRAAARGPGQSADLVLYSTEDDDALEIEVERLVFRASDVARILAGPDGGKAASKKQPPMRGDREQTFLRVIAALIQQVEPKIACDPAARRQGATINSLAALLAAQLSDWKFESPKSQTIAETLTQAQALRSVGIRNSGD